MRARAPAAAGVHAAGRDRSGGQPASRPRGDAGDAGDARRLYGGQQASSDGASAGYRGQIGLRSSWAHAVAHNIGFEEGDVLVTETSAPIWGYNAELERAMVIGEPTDEMRRLFDHTVAAQEVAFEALRPGVTCADVDGAVLAYFEENDLLPYWRQHIGHAIGLRNHEAPFLDVGDHTVVEPGMVFTIEPGLYSAEIGGFRHSDTVVVTADGIDILTTYPKRHREPDPAGLGFPQRSQDGTDDPLAEPIPARKPFLPHEYRLAVEPPEERGRGHPRPLAPKCRAELPVRRIDKERLGLLRSVSSEL